VISFGNISLHILNTQI